jgi:peptidoglycan/xylan/chitin deacetylase (PgdA/CDA1 family)
VQDKGITILNYHKVFNYANREDIRLSSLLGGGISIEDFEVQIKFLIKNYNLISLYKALDYLSGRIDIKPNSLVITFDDVTRDNYRNAFPVLKKWGINATFFLSTGSIETGQMLWIHKRKCLENILGLIGFIEEFNRVTPYLKINEHSKMALKTVLKFKLKAQERQRILDTIFNSVLKKKDESFDSDHLYLSWNEVKEMSNAGMLFGSHTVTHPVLAMEEEDVVRDEILRSKKEIENRIQKKVDLFAYPFGDAGSLDPKIKEILKLAGMRCALTTFTGRNTKFSDLYNLRRVRIVDEPIYSFVYRTLQIRDNYFFNTKMNNTEETNFLN